MMNKLLSSATVNMKNIVKSLALTLLLPFFGFPVALEAQVTLSEPVLNFETRSNRLNGARTRFVFLHNEGTSAVTIGAGAFSGLDHSNTGFSLTTDNCQNTSLAAGASCEVRFAFKPLYMATHIATYGWDVDGAAKRVALINDVPAEPAIDAAQRRLPPVVQKVSFYAVASDGSEHHLDGVNSVTVDGKVLPGDRFYTETLYSVKWFVASYDPAIQSEFALFDCGATATDACAQDFATRVGTSSTGTAGCLLYTSPSPRDA